MDISAIKKNIEFIRRMKALNQEDVAKRMKTSRQNYIRIINRQNDISIQQIQKIAKALEVPASMILLGEDLDVMAMQFMSLFEITLLYWISDLADHLFFLFDKKVKGNMLELSRDPDLDSVKSLVIELWNRQNSVTNITPEFMSKIINSYFDKHPIKIILTRSENDFHISIVVSDGGLLITRSLTRRLNLGRW